MKNIKSYIKTINLKFKLKPQLGMMNFNYLMDHILYQIFKIVLNILSKHMKKLTDNSPINIFIMFYIIYSKMENTITFKIKTGYYLVLLTFKTNEIT